MEFGHSLHHGKPHPTTHFDLNPLKITYSFIKLPSRTDYIPITVLITEISTLARWNSVWSVKTAEMWTDTWQDTVLSVMEAWRRHRPGRRREINSPSASMVPEQSLQRCVEFSDGQWRKVLSEQMPGGFVE